MTFTTDGGVDIVLPLQGAKGNGCPCSRGAAPGYIVMPLRGVPRCQAFRSWEDGLKQYGPGRHPTVHSVRKTQTTYPDVTRAH